MSSLSDRRGALGLGSAIALLVLMAATSASAETLLMPKRDFLKGTSEVVWGVSTQPAVVATTFDLDYGDGSAHTTGNFGSQDRSYIAFNHTYALAGTFTITLTTVNGATTETATVQVNVYDGALLSAADLRGLNINRAIQDGLRYFWFSQTSRAANFPAGVTTTWPGAYPTVTAALTALAFENHGYSLPNNDSVPTGIYEKYIVRRAINYVIDRLQKLTTGMTPNGGDPCVGPGIEPVTTVQPGGAGTGCVSLYSNDTGDAGYEASIAILPLAGSNAFNRHVAEITGTASSGYVVGKTYREILQRQINGLAWGQIDVNNVNRGGWGYVYNSGTSDGSTIGWNMLALLDAAPNSTIPSFVGPEFSTLHHAGPGAVNTDGTFDYNPNDGGVNTGGCCTYINMARSGIGLQALFYMGQVGLADTDVSHGRDAINTRWTASPSSDYLPTCGGTATNNKGCAYAMFNVFKGLKIQGISSLPAAPDWYGEYQDYLVSTQTSHTSTSGGNWGSLAWSCCGSMPTQGPSALAELILAPVTLVAPDPDLFSTVGLSPQTDTNPVSTPHTVTAFVQSSNGTPIAGATVGFDVLSGPNEPATGVCNPVSCISGADGKVTWTYNGGPNIGNDKIRANIGSLLSNVVDKFWVIPSLKCDANSDGKVDYTDLGIIRAAFGQTPSGANDPRDGNSDGAINVLDLRYCQLRLTP